MVDIYVCIYGADMNGEGNIKEARLRLSLILLM